MEDIAAQLKVFIGLIGATFASVIGVIARNMYHSEGFYWRRMLIDFPFAILVALIAGGVGEWLTLPSIIIYGLAGSAGYLGPQWLSGWLTRKADTGIPKGAKDVDRK